MSDQEESPKRETTKESISEVDAQLKRKKECCSAGCGTHGSCGCRQSKKTGRMVVSAGFTEESVRRITHLQRVELGGCPQCGAIGLCDHKFTDKPGSLPLG
ncbi:MAG: hypothetical protein UT48_C0047G0005 [Parcubacteria group bacterium GW2011_GWE2_39_37]|uniref:Uncharacterized protein n=1 Tax=Candidatus Falkowbacteria bacterium GW2011_GWF2_39_8 TaxID=1618642 RepID=A0A0G0Q552_9BACT|nr:MAG: hypothetical protein UT48_C0047G0005 [Parcubacteria group bacterium GW2011_GWE2_39_37]KKR32501.1 MAG: hypothetical protein UT64_C0032G0015 [Candidatus Falkowbacteria bacterium GW2011_GWF2_39_8]